MVIEKKDGYTVESHYLPRSYLNKFTENRLLYWYDVETEKYGSKGVKGQCFIKHYYEVRGLPINTLEKKFANMETNGQKCLNQIANGEIDDSGRIYALQYISSFRIRSPFFRYMQKDVCKTKLGMTDSFKIEDLVRSKLCINIDSCKFQLYDYSIDSMDIIGIKWEGDVLITSDNPVVRCNLNDILHKKIDAEVEIIILPLDPCTLMIVYHKDDLLIIQSGIINNLRNINPVQIRKVIAENAIFRLFFVNMSHLIHFAGTVCDRHEIFDEAAESLKDDMEFADKYWNSIKEDVPGVNDV